MAPERHAPGGAYHQQGTHHMDYTQPTTCTDCNEPAPEDESYYLDGDLLCCGCFHEAVTMATIIATAAAAKRTSEQAAAGGAA